VIENEKKRKDLQHTYVNLPYLSAYNPPSLIGREEFQNPEIPDENRKIEKRKDYR
jgi:hypothetical protein